MASLSVPKAAGALLRPLCLGSQGRGPGFGPAVPLELRGNWNEVRGPFLVASNLAQFWILLGGELADFEILLRDESDDFEDLL